MSSINIRLGSKMREQDNFLYLYSLYFILTLNLYNRSRIVLADTMHLHAIVVLFSLGLSTAAVRRGPTNKQIQLRNCRY